MVAPMIGPSASPMAAKTACGAAETMPYVMVTNLARTLRELQEREIWVVGTAGEAESDLYGAECPKLQPGCWGGRRRPAPLRTRENRDQLVRIPMYGPVESLNVSVAAGICLYEARRRRG